MERPKTVLRSCAIYTLKSSEEGLEQDFNSLHAQREACEAFIQSRRGVGWRLVKRADDDGGLSGAMERPGLQRLLADIGQSLIDEVVVYKVDRLTRSLADFAKMVELFDDRGMSFVAVNQQFNTTTSIGRLTLNACCCRSRNSSARSPASASATGSPPPSAKGSGWVGLLRSAMTSPSATS